jgi:hypothetical protein
MISEEEFVMDQVSKRGIYWYTPSQWDYAMDNAINALVESHYIQDCTDVGTDCNERFAFRLTGTKAAWIGESPDKYGLHRLQIVEG